MQAFLERNFYLVNLLVLGILAGLTALVATTAVESALLVGDKTKKRKHPGLAKKAKKEESKTLRKSQFDVTRRDMFCSDCAPEKSVGKGGDADKPSISMDDAELLATLVSTDPRWSLATIRFKSNSHTRMVRQGDKLEDAEILSVESKRVTFRQGKETGVIELIPGEEKAAPKVAKKKPGRKGKAKKGSWRDKVKKGVRKIGKNKYEIDRSLVMTLTANFTTASRDAAIYPHKKNGKADGFRLGRVRPGGIFAKLGMRSGDVINSVNNTPVTSPDKLLEMYTKLMGASHLTVGISRYGRPQTMDYSIK